MAIPVLGEGWDDFGPIEKQEPKQLPSIPQEDWEVLDASKYFPEYRHANTVTQIDRPAGMQKVEAPQEGFSNEAQEGEASPPQDGDQYCEASPEEQAKHSDQLYEMEAGPDDNGSTDDRELRADKEEDLRTEKPPSEPSEEEGAEEPIQKESEGVDEVAEATAKTSEDTHGGDEATKDVENSPNAANDGMNEDNQGAEEGEDGGDGQEGDQQGQGDAPSSEGGEGNQPGDQPSGEAQGNGEDGQNPFNFLNEEEDWEKEANASAWAERMEHQFVDWKNHERRKEDAGGGKGVHYEGFKQWTPEDAKATFFKVRELIAKLVSQPDPSKKEKGSAKWWLEQVIKETTSFQYHKIPRAKYNRPMKNNIVFFVDISGSVSSLAELFMALMGGAAGLPGVHIVVGSEAHAEKEIVVSKPFKNVEAAIEFFRGALSHETSGPMCAVCQCILCTGKMGTGHIGWQRAYEEQFEPGVIQYLKDKNLYNASTTCIFFGDMQAVNFNVPELLKIVRTCQCLWLFTDEPGHYTHTGDLPKAIEAQMPIAYGISGARAFLAAVRKVRFIKKGMQIIP